MPQSDFVDRSRQIWDELVKQLRAANPGQKIAFRHKTHELVVDGTVVPISLDTERIGDGYRMRHGRYYFTIGAWRKNVTRPRAIERKDGFDWACIAQRVEAERQRLVYEKETQEGNKARLAKCRGELEALFERRPELAHLQVYVNVLEGSGTYSFKVNGMDVKWLETVLDIANWLEES